MAKRKTVEIDESVILDMMSSDIPAYGRNTQPEPDAGKPETDLPSAGDNIVTVEAPKPRRRKEPKDYGAIFLKKRVPEQRKHAYLSVELLSRIADFLPVIAKDINVPTFIDNVLSHHLEAYRDEINELYDQKTRKPL